MKEIIELLLELRITPRIFYFDEERSRNQSLDIDRLSSFESLSKRPLGLGINCAGGELMALSFYNPKDHFLNLLYDKLGVGEEYKWIVTTDDREIVYLRVPDVSKNFGSQYSGVELSPTQPDTFSKALAIAHASVVFAPLEMNDKVCSFKHGPPARETPLKEYSFNALVKILSDVSNIDAHVEKLIENANETVAEESFVEHVETPLLPYRIFDKLPKRIKSFIDQFKQPREKDMSLLSLIVVLSACLPNVVSRHRNKKIWAHLYLAITAGAASGKGVLADVIRVISKIETHYREIFNNELRKYKAEYKAYKAREIPDEPIKPKLKTVLLPTDNSFIALFEQLYDNGGSGLMFETEIDTFVNAGNQEWANYGLLNRKATHHEPHVLDRKTLEQPLYLASPKIAMVMGGTPNQFFSLFKSIEDGLFSRHLIYAFELRKITIENPFLNDETMFFDSTIEETENFVFSMYDLLVNKTYEVEFQWTEHQSKTLHSTFVKVFDNSDPVYGEGTASIVLRYMLAASRIGMVLTAVEAFEDGQLNDSRKLIASDQTMEVVIDILATCSQHSFLMMTNIKANSKGRTLDMKSMNMLRFFNALPDGNSFKTKDAIQVGRSLNISARSVGDYLPALCKSKHIDQVSYGVYKKTR